MLRVLITGFCGLPAPDRAGVQVGHIVRALTRHHAVDVLVARRGDQAYVERTGAARILRVPVQSGDIRAHIAAYRRALRRQLEGADYDVVYFRDAWAGGPVLEMKAQLGYATVFDAARGPISGSARRRQGALLPPQIGCLQAADLVLAGTEQAREHFAQLTRKEKIHVVPPGVDIDQFDWDEAPDGPPRVLYVGTIAPGRGVRVLLRAMLDIARHSDAVLTLAGPVEPGFTRTLESAAADLGLGERVELCGEVKHSEVAALISRAAVCVVPAAADLQSPPVALFPTKMLEYMACMRPVIAPRVGTVELLCRDGEHGLLFRPGDPGDLTRQIAHLLAEPKLAKKLARAGYDKVREAFPASATRRALRRAHAWLAAEPGWAAQFGASEAGQAAMAADIEQGRWRREATDINPHADDRAQARSHDDTSPGEITTVDITGDGTRESEPAADTRVTKVADSDEPWPVEPSLDQWVVEDLLTRFPAEKDAPAKAEDDDPEDGTPVQVVPLPAAPAALTENRFVSGEVEVPDSPLAPADEPFDLTAVSVLLGPAQDPARGSKSD